MADATRLLGLALLVLGCASTSAAPKAAAPSSAAGAEKFLPLVDDTVFAYDTESQPSGERGLLVLEVHRRGPDRAELAVAGHVTRLTLDETGIRLVTGGWLLKTPLVEGASWQGDYGQVRVTALDKPFASLAGQFSGCLETLESAQGPNFTKSTRTTYCPDVGIVSRVTQVESDEGDGSETIRLRSHGPRFDVNSTAR